jgi:putative endonuclease
MAFYTYIVASRRNGTLYVGSTDSIVVRTSEHKQKLRGGFTSKYGVDRLVWYEAHETRAGAFMRERQIKKWNRVWKLELIEKANPEWRDLFDDLF